MAMSNITNTNARNKIGVGFAVNISEGYACRLHHFDTKGCRGSLGYVL
jgi:hypothetical protein